MKKQHKKRLRYPVPIREIAKAVNRSPIHVWRILNNKGDFSADTAKKVRKIIANANNRTRVRLNELTDNK
jgi:DNA-binding LacI/PurR family transcriptional regulator